MFKYEFAHIIRSEGKSDEEIQAVIGNVRELIAELGGRIIKEDVWDKKELAYEIDKQANGFYMFTILMMEPAQAIELEKKMKLMEGTLRYMIINLDREPGYLAQIKSDEEDAKKEQDEKNAAIAASTDDDKEESTKPEPKFVVEDEAEEEEVAEDEDEDEETEAEEEVAEEEEVEKPVKKVKKKVVKDEKAEKKKLDELLDEKLSEIL